MGLLYTKMKIFHYPEKLASLPREKDAILPPLHIRMKPTNACNHNCGYCAYRVDKLQLGQSMQKADAIPREKMLEIVEDVVAMGVRAVTFSGGGEPLIYPHLLESCQALRAGGVRIAALTNGSLLRGELADFLAYEATWIRVSMDGFDGPSYAAYRGAPETEYALVMDNMRRFKNRGGPCYLGVSLIVDERNHRKVYEQVARLKDMGVDSVKISPCIVANDGEANNAYHKPFFAAVARQAEQAEAELNDADFLVYNAYHELDAKFQKLYTWCPYMQILPVIAADQCVYPCQDKAYNQENGLLGSLKDQRFKDFWYSDKNTFFTIDPSRDCNHHCVANAKNLLIHEYLDASFDHLAFV